MGEHDQWHFQDKMVQCRRNRSIELLHTKVGRQAPGFPLFAILLVGFATRNNEPGIQVHGVLRKGRSCFTRTAKGRKRTGGDGESGTKLGQKLESSLCPSHSYSSPCPPEDKSTRNALVAVSAALYYRSA